MRGLKLPLVLCLYFGNLVASFTDAWIETKKKRHFMNLVKVASFTDAWIETKAVVVMGKSFESHLLQMRGLKPF